MIREEATITEQYRPPEQYDEYRVQQDAIHAFLERQDTMHDYLVRKNVIYDYLVEQDTICD